MRYRCVRKCTFMGRYWEPGQVCDLGDGQVPAHFIVTDEAENAILPKARQDIMKGAPKGVKASTYYEIAKTPQAPMGGMASTLEKQETFHSPKQLRRK